MDHCTHRNFKLLMVLLSASAIMSLVIFGYKFPRVINIRRSNYHEKKIPTSGIMISNFPKREKNIPTSAIMISNFPKREKNIPTPAIMISNFPKREKNIYYQLDVQYSGVVFTKNAILPMTLTSNYIISNVYLCSQFLFLLYVVVVQTSPPNFARRQALRDTWAQENLFTGENSKTVFFLGRTSDERIQNKILLESEEHGDIVQGDFVDHYENLTLKTVLRLRWVTENCMNSKYVIKVDDDAFLNIFYIKENFFPILKANPDQLIGWVYTNSHIIRRNEISLFKWHLPDDQFKGMSSLPMPICYGYANFFTTSLAQKLFKQAKSTPVVRLEDVYMSGLLASKVKGLTWRNEGEIFFKYYLDTVTTLLTKGPNSMAVGSIDTAKQANVLWRFLTELKQNHSISIQFKDKMPD